jgi:CRISPR-associated exonuclease Cas4
MSYNDEDLIQISALQHYAFCKRQCALIHIEQVWTENVFTAEGRIMHEKAHEENFRYEKGIKIESGVPIRSLKYGVTGKADIIEYRQNEKGERLPFPIEYKRGRPKIEDCDRIQLCAQAICIEEMTGLNVTEGDIFYGRTRRRCSVFFNKELRALTADSIDEIRGFLNKGITPAPDYSKKCESCSLADNCLPKAIQKKTNMTMYYEEFSKDI